MTDNLNNIFYSFDNKYFLKPVWSVTLRKIIFFVLIFSRKHQLRIKDLCHYAQHHNKYVPNLTLAGFVLVVQWYLLLYLSTISSTISFIIFWDFSMFYQIVLSPKVKRWAIVTYKHGIYELLHELPNDLRLKKFGNNRKVSKLHRMIA